MLNFSYLQPISAHFDANLSSTKKVGESAKEVPGEGGSKDTEVSHSQVNQAETLQARVAILKTGARKKNQFEHQEPKDTETLLTNVTPEDKRHL